MAKKIIEPILVEIKQLIGNEKLLVGTEETLKNLKLGKIAKVYLASNCAAQTKKDIEHYSELNGANIVNLNLNNNELGTVCKKPFSISVLSVLK